MTLKVALAQIAPVWLNREKTLEKILEKVQVLWMVQKVVLT